MLCESPWSGGAGYTPEQVARLTLDQVWFRLCDLSALRREIGRRVLTVPAAGIASMAAMGPDGTIAGRAADGTPIRGRIAGKSLARQLMERAQKRGN